MVAHDEGAEPQANIILIQLPNNKANGFPVVNLSGCVFVSGGALWYKSSGLTYTQLAAY